MKNMKMRVLSIVLTLCMIFAMAPISVAAEDAVEVSTEQELRDAIAGSDPVIRLTADIANITDRITINRDVEIDGGGYTVGVADDFLMHNASNSVYGGKGNPVLEVVGCAVTLKNIIVDGEGRARHGINVFEAQLTLDNVTSKNNCSGLTVNNSTVIATD